tara:strand:- start:865 stop:1470 length:606 start_codon:yes stop_codon:yes gene_type:complete
MFALVESGSITKYFSGNQGVTINDVQHPKAIFTIWTEAERNAIGVYTVEMDESKKKDEKWYINTDITYSFGSDKVTGSYGDATARAHADTTWTAQDETDGKGTEGEIKAEGLKTKLIRDVKEQSATELARTDWYVVRKAEEDTAIPSSITTHRKAVRSKQAAMETSITNASDTPALETLYTYTRQEDGSVTRPLGEIPTLD